ncbi:hypothetical protein [Clostridium omnivorum]|uniref:DNA-binding protein n=1 Tax=Clostridium omnivorum TaxID=1604902 RepID=A0ABQ5NC20_9CLOT|nr:hypothetical protein [Clostridium sp. E14]GLC32646.1 hypothetical protein bsdE14_40560 [Clostridium sp. E14]
MKLITMDEFFKELDGLKNTNLVAIVNAYELDTVYCIDELQYELINECYGKILRLFSKNGMRDYYDYNGVYISLKDIAKISTTEDTIYVYLQNQVVKLKFK